MNFLIVNELTPSVFRSYVILWAIAIVFAYYEYDSIKLNWIHSN